MVAAAAEEWDIELRFVHTPGALLHRPDQTSRGDPIEETRVRLAAAEFAAIERLTGWVHPTHSTVVSALRRVGERLSEAGGQRISGVVVVPDAPNAG